MLLASRADESGANEYFPRSGKTVVHGWGLAPDLFRLQNVNPRKIREELGISESTPLIGTTTRVAPKKGQETLIHALPSVVRKFPELKCVILGGRYDVDQPETDRLKKIAEELGVQENAIFLGERDDTADIFAAYDVAVHLADHDYLPFGVLECMALGKACLCTGVGGIPEIISNGETGILVDAGYPEKAGVELIRLIENPGLRDEIGSNARKFVLERYDLDRLVVRVGKMYEDAIKGEIGEVYGEWGYCFDPPVIPPKGGW